MNVQPKRSAIGLPSSGRCQLWIDFDGTLTQQDVLDELISRYAIDDSWRVIEQRWQRGEVGSRQCLTEQLDLVRISPAELDALLAGITLDPGAVALIEAMESRGVPVVVLSDCVELFIRLILERHGLGRLSVRSNTAVFHNHRLKLQCPHENARCTFGAAHCKCASMDVLGQGGRRSIYVGDGRSDLCASMKADVVFAKGVLAQCLDKESLPYVRYSTLHDVTHYLAAAWQSAAMAEAYVATAHPSPVPDAARGEPVPSPGYRDTRATA